MPSAKSFGAEWVNLVIFTRREYIVIQVSSADRLSTLVQRQNRFNRR
jgi:hypothetical protein